MAHGGMREERQIMADELLSVSLSGFDRIGKNFASSPAVIKEATSKMLDMATMVAWGKAKELAPVAKSTLRASLQRKVEGFVGKIMTSMSYAGFQEYGTGIYSDHPSAPKVPITPKRARFLVFQKNGKIIFARQVLGSRPRKFMRGGLAEVNARMPQIFDIGKKVIGYSLLQKWQPHITAP